MLKNYFFPGFSVQPNGESQSNQENFKTLRLLPIANP